MEAVRGEQWPGLAKPGDLAKTQPNTRPSTAPTSRTLLNIRRLAPSRRCHPGSASILSSETLPAARADRSRARRDRRLQRRLVLQAVVPVHLIKIQSEAGISIAPAHAGRADGDGMARARVNQRDALDQKRREVDGVDRLDPLRFVDDVPGENLRLVAVALEKRAQRQIEKRVAASGVGEHVRAAAHLHAARRR